MDEVSDWSLFLQVSTELCCFNIDLDTISWSLYIEEFKGYESIIIIIIIFAFKGLVQNLRRSERTEKCFLAS